MKPIRVLSFFLLSCLLVLASCVEENTFDTTKFVLSFTPGVDTEITTLDFESSGGQENVRVISNTTWTVSSEASWITLSKTSGMGNDAVMVLVAENPSTNSRNGYIAFSSGSSTVYVSISQSGASHGYVDLGLPSGLLWATCNVGATSPEDYGNYFAWGDTEPQSTYYWSTYKHSQGSGGPTIILTKYNTDSSYGTIDNKTVLDPEDDAANVGWGGGWRMPTIGEYEEILNNCTWTWTTQGGHNGYKIASQSNGNSIFLPAAGYHDVTNLNNAGSDGCYWSSTLNTSSPLSAMSLHFGLDYHFVYPGNRLDGCFVRPVYQPGQVEPYFEVSKENLDYPSAGGTEEIKLTTNLTWTTTTSEEWVTLSSAYGTGDATLSIVVPENTSSDARTGNITFTAGEFSITVSITQEGSADGSVIGRDGYGDDDDLNDSSGGSVIGRDGYGDDDDLNGSAGGSVIGRDGYGDDDDLNGSAGGSVIGRDGYGDDDDLNGSAGGSIIGRGGYGDDDDLNGSAGGSIIGRGGYGDDDDLNGSSGGSIIGRGGYGDDENLNNLNNGASKKQRIILKNNKPQTHKKQQK